MSNWEIMDGFPRDIVESPQEIDATYEQYMQALQQLLQMTDEEFAEYRKKIEEEVSKSE